MNGRLVCAKPGREGEGGAAGARVRAAPPRPVQSGWRGSGMAQKLPGKVPLASAAVVGKILKRETCACCFEFLEASSALMAKPPSTGRWPGVGAFVLLGGVVLLLVGVLGAFYSWKVDSKEIYNVHYTVSVDGKLQEGSMEVDTANNLEIFKTGSGGEEAVEVHDFQNGITGIHFAGGGKCFIKAQAKIHIPEVSAMSKESLSFDLEDEILPAKFDENSLVWVAGDQPVKNYNFLSPKILELCSDLQIFWLRPSSPKEIWTRLLPHYVRIWAKKGGITRKTCQTQPNIDLDQFEAAAEEVNTRPHSKQWAREQERSSDATQLSGQISRPTFNPENPYHQLEAGEGMSFDPWLDHEGICCIECTQSYTHCQWVCEPLLGYSPWPYHFQGCRSACRLILPCNWWVARILGIV
ncbi:leukocyte cell-derived chemotaxin 1 [Candoia aspera]|uniref:leukocyte cell-derived chemotaxin 1 n=1 Tax=Candoia aspera TaxID=51853 RepID=UPI002FD841A2